MWDVKNLRQPLAVHKDVTNVYSETGVAWSPDGKYVLVGTAVDPRKEDAIGEILFLSAADLSVERRVPIAKGASVVRVVWHSRINQIFASLSNGSVYVLYSPHSSIHGALLPLAKMPRTKARDVSYTTADLTPVIYTPDAGGLGGPRLGMSAHQREKRAKKFKPTEPVHGIGRGGRIGASATAGFVAEMFASGARVGLEDVSGETVPSWVVLTPCHSPARRCSSMPPRRRRSGRSTWPRRASRCMRVVQLQLLACIVASPPHATTDY